MNITPSAQAQRAERSPTLSSPSSALLEFDPAAYPIIAAHWFGLRPIGVVIFPIVQRIESLREASDATA